MNPIITILVNWLSSLTHKPKQPRRVALLNFSLIHFNSPKTYR